MLLWFVSGHLRRTLVSCNHTIDRAYFIINIKTARVLGLTIPQSAIVRADEVLQ